MRKKKKKYENAIYWCNSNFEKETVTKSNLAKHCNFILSEADIKHRKIKRNIDRYL